MPVVTWQWEMNIASSLWVVCLYYHDSRYMSKAAKMLKKMQTQTETIQQFLLSMQRDRSSYIMIRLHFAQAAQLKHANLACSMSHLRFRLKTFFDLCPLSYAVSASLLCQDKTCDCLRVLTALSLVLSLPLAATTAVTAVDGLRVDHCRFGECSWRGLSSPTSGSGALMTHR